MNKQQRQVLEQEMFSLIEKWQESNLNQQAFCQEHEITYSKFLYWLKKYRQQQENVQGFIPIEVSGHHQLIELRYPNGVILQLPSVDLKLLKQLVNL